jgi:hypothetical protein
MKTETPQDQRPEAWVVFSGKADLPWLRVLKPGFRHCYVILNDGRRWFSLDPLSTYSDLAVHHHVPAGFDMPLWLESRGCAVVKTPLRRPLKPAPWMMFTCVEAVKRVIGLQDRFIWTPWQLYRRLVQNQTSPSQDKGEFAWEA